MTDEDFALYDEFVGRLEPGDVIITFNYDTILERTFSRKGIPFRLFPTRLKNIGFGGGEVMDTDEIVLLKMHGSINWFDVSVFDEHQEAFRDQGTYVRPRHEVFAKQKEPFLLQKIIDGPYSPPSPLQKIYIAADIKKYLANCSFTQAAPLIISPSFSKMVYLNPLTDFGVATMPWEWAMARWQLLVSLFQITMHTSNNPCSIWSIIFNTIPITRAY